MEYEGFRLMSFIFENKYKLEKERFSLSGDSDAVYDFFIDVVGHNALDISTFCRYTEIATLSNQVEKNLHQLISYNAKLASTLASEAADKAYRLYGEKIRINVGDINYIFSIDGVGPKAIKMTCQITYDEIASSDKPLESYLRELINKLYSTDDKNSIDEINRQ